jgi:transposase
VAELVSVEIAMEPSGTYGDSLRYLLESAGFAVYRVNPKHTNDAKEIYDGVPSLHDAKSAAIIAKLHRDGRSQLWPIKDERERTLTASLRVLEIHSKQFQQNRNRLANLLAKHWPELPQHLALDSATLLELLSAFGCPKTVTDKRGPAHLLMTRVGGRFLVADKVDAVIATARATVGVPMVEEERQMLMHIAQEARRNQVAANKARRRVEKLAMGAKPTKELSTVVGKTTAAVLVSAVGDPRKYHCASAYEKSLGLNLKEKSSGQYKGGLHITKRGPSVARLYLWMAALRMIKNQPVIRAWYAKKVRRQGGQAKAKAVVAIMRKLVKALWHVAQGKVFDPCLLYDTTRLNLHEALVELP